MIDALSELLREERQAIAKIDLAALSSLASKKESLIEALSRDRSAIDPDAMRKLLAEADANRMLINDALESLREMLGGDDKSGLYDSRARYRSTSHRLIGTKL